MAPTRRFTRWIIGDQRFSGSSPSPSPKISARVLLLAVLSISASGQVPRAATGDVLPFTATERTLANGLKIIVVPTGLPNLVSVQIPVQTGSRNEVEPSKSGFAHFFEHLMFRAFSPIKYDGEKPKALLDEDQVIGALKLNIAPDKVKITPIGEVFAR